MLFKFFLLTSVQWGTCFFVSAIFSMDLPRFLAQSFASVSRLVGIR